VHENKQNNNNFIELLKVGYVRRATERDLTIKWPNVLNTPMSFVMNTNKQPVKTRNVYDNSAKYKGTSLRIRLFMQVQKIFWRKNQNEPIQGHITQVVSFGTKPSPFNPEIVKLKATSTKSPVKSQASAGEAKDLSKAKEAASKRNQGPTEFYNSIDEGPLMDEDVKLDTPRILLPAPRVYVIKANDISFLILLLYSLYSFIIIIITISTFLFHFSAFLYQNCNGYLKFKLYFASLFCILFTLKKSVLF
jgi:hypothetical protein